MAALPDADRAACTTEFTNETGNLREELAGCTKADVRAAVNALDDYLNANAATINGALPLPFRTSATQAQRARMFNWVVRYRYIKG